MPKLFLLPLEVSNRDLNWKLLLAQKILKPGDIALVGHHDVINSFVSLSRIASNYIGKNLFETAPPADQTIYQALKKTCSRLFYLHDEGIFFGDENNWRKCYSNLVDSSCIQPPDVVFAWSANQADFFYSQLCRAEICTLGHPRFNLYHEKYRPFSLPSNYEYLDQASNAVLFISKFAVINSGLGVNKLISNSDRLPVSSKYRWSQLIAKECLGFHRFLASICALLSETDEKIVIRPHPAEDCTLYHNIFDFDPRVTIIPHGDLAPLILLSKCVVQSGSCTSGIESYIAGKSVISLCASEVNEYLNPSDYTHIIGDPKELIQFIQGIDSNCRYSSPHSDPAKLRKSVLFNLNIDTYDEFSVFIQSRAVDSSSILIAPHVICFVLMSKIYSFTRAIKTFLKRIFRHKVSSLTYAMFQFPPLSRRSLLQKIEILNNYFKGESNAVLLLKSISRYSFILRK